MDGWWAGERITFGGSLSSEPGSIVYNADCRDQTVLWHLEPEIT